jgi:hypothetical protein
VTEGESDAEAGSSRLLALWAEVSRAFPRLGVVARLMGNHRMGIGDLAAFRRSRRVRRLAERVSGLSDADMDTLEALAELHQGRQTFLSRVLLITYVTVPAAVLAIWVQLSPGGLGDLVIESPLVIGGGVSLVLLGILLQIGNEIRAREIHWALRLLGLERRRAGPRVSRAEPSEAAQVERSGAVQGGSAPRATEVTAEGSAPGSDP